MSKKINKDSNCTKWDYFQIEDGPKNLDYVWIKNYIDFTPKQKELGRIYISEYNPKALIIKGLFRYGDWKYSEVEISFNNDKVQYNYPTVWKYSKNKDGSWDLIFNPPFLMENNKLVKNPNFKY